MDPMLLFSAQWELFDGIYNIRKICFNWEIKGSENPGLQQSATFFFAMPVSKPDSRRVALLKDIFSWNADTKKHIH